MIKMVLKRIATDDKRTFGVLIDKDPFAVTLEDPWKENESFVSCILAGDYRCVRIKSPKFGDVFEIMNVPGRDHILFHWGNREKDTQGCVLIAEKFGRLAGEAAVLTSKNRPGEGFNEFMEKLKGLDEFWISIEWHCDH